MDAPQLGSWGCSKQLSQWEMAPAEPAIPQLPTSQALEKLPFQRAALEFINEFGSRSGAGITVKAEWRLLQVSCIGTAAESTRFT